MEQRKFAIALCDDDGDFLEALASLVREIAMERGLAYEVFCYAEAKGLLEDIHAGKKFSILLLDVVMEGMDGLELLSVLRREAWQTPVLFVSAYPEKAMYGYEVEALRFLAKPVQKERLREALAAAERRLEGQSLVLQTPDGLKRVDIREIRYAEMLRRGVGIHMANGTVVATRMKIGEMERLLPSKRFFRCHQGYIVNLEDISTILRTDAVLTSGDRVPVSRYKLADLREHFVAYLND